MSDLFANLIIVRGAGDIASGIICRLKRSGFNVMALETEAPLVIRRTVSFAPAVTDGCTEVEGITARLVTDENGIIECLEAGEVPLAVDPEGSWISRLEPGVVIDAIMAKVNLGTVRNMAPLVIGIGPGFEAGKDVDAVIETRRGHDLGRVILMGTAEPDTGVPGNVGGYSHERVIHAAAEGVLTASHEIGDHVEKGEVIADISGAPVCASLTGTLRGLIADGTYVRCGLKIADIDPRDVKGYCWSVSDKANSIAGGVLEAILRFASEGIM